MPNDFVFEGGHIFNFRDYPDKVMAQAMPVMKQMSKNVDPNRSPVDIDRATQDLSAKGYSLRHASAVGTFNSLDAVSLKTEINGLVQGLFEESIQLRDGDAAISSLIQSTVGSSGSTGRWQGASFASISRSQSSNSSHQLTFYSMKKASFCFLILSIMSLQNQQSVLGTPSQVTGGFAYDAYVFEIKKRHQNLLYEFGVLKSGESLVSPNGEHRVTLSEDGNLTVGLRWQTGTANKGESPYRLSMKGDANLAVYDKNEQMIWSSQTRVGGPLQTPCYVELQDDGILTIYDAKHQPLWSAGFAQK